MRPQPQDSDKLIIWPQWQTHSGWTEFGDAALEFLISWEVSKWTASLR
jgi:hypothetical protein